MSDDPKKTSKKRSGTDTARRIWLAGIGAYGRAFTEAQEALKDVTGEASDVFDNLVQKGEMIEMAVQVKSKDMMDKVGVPSFDMPDLDMSERIQKMRSRLQRGPDGNELSDIEARLTRIEDNLDALLAASKPVKKPSRKPTKKAAASKARTTRTTKKT